jgi:hypothetical protein
VISGRGPTFHNVPFGDIADAPPRRRGDRIEMLAAAVHEL